jgi:hypothetical protein
MTQFSDQLSAVRQAQFEAQLDFFRTFTTRALDSAGQLAALNVRTSRASVEQAAGTVKQLLEVRDPRDLFALGSAAQGQLNALFSYGRELAGIAAGARALSAPLPIPLLAAPAPTANVPTSYTQVIEQASIATDAAATISGEIAAAAVDIGAAHAGEGPEQGLAQAGKRRASARLHRAARSRGRPGRTAAGDAAGKHRPGHRAAAEGIALVAQEVSESERVSEAHPICSSLAKIVH